MQKQPDLAKNLQNLFKDNSYKEFQAGSFLNHPQMTGYYYIFKNITDPKFCIILNTSQAPYPSNMVEINDYVFIVFNIESIEEYMENLGTNYFPQILSVLDQKLQKKNPRNLPYGYYTDENGKIRIDLKKANEVKKIYDRYIETESVRTIAEEMRTNFSHVREVLHANEEYMQMQPKILSMTLLRKVNELLAVNVKGAFKKRRLADEIEEVRKKRKEKEKLMGLR